MKKRLYKFRYLILVGLCTLLPVFLSPAWFPLVSMFVGIFTYKVFEESKHD